MSLFERTVNTLRQEHIRFDEHYVNLNDMLCRPTTDFKDNQGAGSKSNLLSTALEFQKNTFFPTTRFWVSFCAKVGISPSVFNLFTHKEVFDRCRETNKVSETGNVRIVEDVKHKELLAISDPTKEIIHWDNAYNLLEKKKATGVSLHDGVITSFHELPANVPMRVGLENYTPRICVTTPIDGYGSPTIYLALIREDNDTVLTAMGRAFKSTIKISKAKKKKDPIEYSMERMFDSFSNDEGFDALVRRLDASRKASMSVREFHEIQKYMNGLPKNPNSTKEIDRIVRPEVRLFNKMAGDLHLKYGLAHLQEMTEKQMSLLPTDLTVYEGFNFISELCTYKIDWNNPIESNVAMKLQQWIGRTLSRAYDLEGTIDIPKDSHQKRYLV